MDAIKITDLFDSELVNEINHWLDDESPYYEDGQWHLENGVYKLNNAYTNTLHKLLTDKSREVFAVHNLLPTTSYIKWYEDNSDFSSHIDKGAEEYTIIYNYFSENPIVLEHENQKIEIGINESIAYVGSSNFHKLNDIEGYAVIMYFSFAPVQNLYFKFGQYNGDGTVTLPSGVKHGYS